MSAQRLGWMWTYFAMLLVVLASHGLAINGTFHFDDSHTIELNPAVKELSKLPAIWTDTTSFSAIPENRIYRPFTFTVFNLLWSVGGGAPWVFLLFKLLVHAGVAALLGLAWIEIFSRSYPTYSAVSRTRTAWVLSILFAAHPACAEVANYVSATTSLLAGFFYVLAFLSFIRRKAAISLAAYALACFSKEEGITLPAVLIAYTALFETHGIRVATVRRVWPWCAAGLVFLAVILGMMPNTLGESRGSISSWTYFITQWRAYLFYFGLSFAPFDLNADNSSFGFSSSILEFPVLLAAFGNALVLATAWIFRERLPTLTFGILWFYIAISPASSVVPLAEPVNEHRMYLAYLGWFGAIGTIALFLSEEGLALKPSWLQVRMALVAVLVPLCVLSQVRASTWNDPKRLWTDTVKKNPENGRALNNLALIYIREARYTEALPLLRRCAEVWPGYPYCAINEGIALGELQRFDEAERSFQRALQIGTAQVYVNYYYGRFLEEKRQKPGAATVHYEKSSRLSNGSFIDAGLRLNRLKSLGF